MVGPDCILSLSPTVSVLPLGDELTVFDAATGETLALNRTAADVLALLDGQTTIQELVVQLARTYPLPASQLVAAVSELADTLLARGTVRVTGDPVAGLFGPS